MSESPIKKNHGDLTQSIRALSVPVDTVGDAFEDQEGTALIVCRDNDSKKWGPRWLNQSGFQATVATDPVNTLAVARSMQPDVIFIEAGLPGPDGELVFKSLLDAADLQATIVTLCGNARDITTALDAGAFDIARKPYNWQAIANRARHALNLRSREATIEATNEALKEALEVANVARQRLRSSETFEPVTGLPNKTKFMDLLRRGMHAATRDGTNLAVFVIGFTRFRLVIEAMGQEQADRVMTEIGHSLDEVLRSSSNVVEPAGKGLRTAAVASLDQFRFGLMMTSPGDGDLLTSFQQQLSEKLSRPVQVAGQTVYLSACLGVALYPQDADDVDSLLQRADNAMRDAQSRGGGFKYYCTETDAAAARKLRLEHMLHEALDREELSLEYQPIIDVASGKMISAEALLRWRQSDGSFIQPDEFVVIAEESGLMIRTGEYVLERACRDFAAWRRDGVPIPYICVNVAKVQLMSANFTRSVQRILKKYAIAAEDIEFEISERGVLSGDYDVISQLHELKSLGVKLSIDDFGTGDSAIAYLKELPVDALKIDRSYVAGLTDDSKVAAIASAMVALGQRLDLLVVAEGVETAEQLEVLHELRCNAYQGFLTARPMPPENFVIRARQLS